MGEFTILMIVYFFVIGFNSIYVKGAQNKRASLSNALIFTFMFSLFQMIMLLFFNIGNFKPMAPKFMELAFLYSACFTISYVFFIKALEIGPTGITNAIFAFYIIVPIIFSAIFTGEQLSILKIVGLILFCASLYIYNLTFGKDKYKKKLVRMWIILILVATFFRGASVLFTKECMESFQAFKIEYLIIINAFIAVISFVFIIRHPYKIVKRFKDIKLMKNTFIASVTQNINNFIFVFYISAVDSVKLLPLLSFLNIFAVVVFSSIIFKEKITKANVVGTIFCIISLVMLNV